MIAFVLIFLGLSILVVIHELGHFLAAKWFGLWVEEFGFGLPPRLWGKKIGDTLYSFNWLPFGGFVRIFGESQRSLTGNNDLQRAFFVQPVWKRALIVAAGVLMNFLLGWFLISAVFMVGIPQALLITDVKEGGIAATAGMQGGDRIFGFTEVPAFVNFINQNKGGEIALNIQRKGESLEIKVAPRLVVPEGEGNLGIYLVESGLPRLGILSSFWEGLKTSARISAAIFLGILDLIIGVFTDIRVLERFTGPVGIVNVAIETTKLGLAPFIQLLAMISLNLAVFNIFPIPALDGGRLLFLIIEKIKGGPLNPKTELSAISISFVFLFFLILAITIKDILTLF